MILENYKKLDNLLHNKKANALEVENIFRKILEDAIEIVNEKFKKNEFLDVEKEDEKAAIRAMFEYMIELWAEGAVDEAKQLGYDMLYLVEDKKLKEMFSMFVIGMLEGLSMDKFFEKYVKDNKIYKDYFFVDFDNSIDKLIIKHKKQFQEEYSKDAE